MHVHGEGKGETSHQYEGVCMFKEKTQGALQEVTPFPLLTWALIVGTKTRTEL